MGDYFVDAVQPGAEGRGCEEEAKRYVLRCLYGLFVVRHTGMFHWGFGRGDVDEEERVDDGSHASRASQIAPS